MRARSAGLAAAAILLAAFACGTPTATIGPVTFDVPSGWFITDRTANSLKVTNGTIGEDTTTEAGSATAVFDVYVNQTQTVEQFKEALAEYNVVPDEERVRLDGYEAWILSYERSGFGPPGEVAFVPEWRVRIVYRAAFADADAAFARNRPAFREAVSSVRFSGRPEERA